MSYNGYLGKLAKMSGQKPPISGSGKGLQPLKHHQPSPRKGGERATDKNLKRGFANATKVLERLIKRKQEVCFRLMLENMAKNLKLKSGLHKVLKVIGERRRTHALKFMEKLLLYADFDFNLSDRSSFFNSTLNQSLRISNKSYKQQGKSSLKDSIGAENLSSSIFMRRSRGGTSLLPETNNGKFLSNILNETVDKSKIVDDWDDIVEENCKAEQEEEVERITFSRMERYIEKTDNLSDRLSYLVEKQGYNKKMSRLEEILDKTKGIYSVKKIDRFLVFERVFIQLERVIKNTQRMRLIVSFEEIKRFLKIEKDFNGLAHNIASSIERMRIMRLSKALQSVRLVSELSKLRAASILVSKITNIFSKRTEQPLRIIYKCVEEHSIIEKIISKNGMYIRRDWAPLYIKIIEEHIENSVAQRLSILLSIKPYNRVISRSSIMGYYLSKIATRISNQNITHGMNCFKAINAHAGKLDSGILHFLKIFNKFRYQKAFDAIEYYGRAKKIRINNCKYLAGILFKLVEQRKVLGLTAIFSCRIFLENRVYSGTKILDTLIFNSDNKFLKLGYSYIERIAERQKMQQFSKIEMKKRFFITLEGILSKVKTLKDELKRDSFNQLVIFAINRRQESILWEKMIKHLQSKALRSIINHLLRANKAFMFNLIEKNRRDLEIAKKEKIMEERATQVVKTIEMILTKNVMRSGAVFIENLKKPKGEQFLMALDKLYIRRKYNAFSKILNNWSVISRVRRDRLMQVLLLGFVERRMRDGFSSIKDYCLNEPFRTMIGEHFFHERAEKPSSIRYYEFSDSIISRTKLTPKNGFEILGSEVIYPKKLRFDKYSSPIIANHSNITPLKGRLLQSGVDYTPRKTAKKAGYSSGRLLGYTPINDPTSRRNSAASQSSCRRLRKSSYEPPSLRKILSNSKERHRNNSFKRSFTNNNKYPTLLNSSNAKMMKPPRSCSSANIFGYEEGCAYMNGSPNKVNQQAALPPKVPSRPPKVFSNVSGLGKVDRPKISSYYYSYARDFLQSRAYNQNEEEGPRYKYD